MESKTHVIKDSGEMREFETGAHRDSNSAVQKGRPDILPLDVVSRVMNDDVLKEMWAFIREQNTDHVISAIRMICEKCPEWENNVSLAMWDTSFLYEDGGKKYGFGNWTHGMPVQVYLDSGLRHYLKWRAGITDEPHHRAAVWNFLNLVWTYEHIEGSKEEFQKYVTEVWHN